MASTLHCTRQVVSNRTNRGNKVKKYRYSRWRKKSVNQSHQKYTSWVRKLSSNPPMYIDTTTVQTRP